MVRVALQRSDLLRSKFRDNISIFTPDMFVFIDETGSDQRDLPAKVRLQLERKASKSIKTV